VNQGSRKSVSAEQVGHIDIADQCDIYSHNTLMSSLNNYLRY
jgi:hypothetical protein